MNSTGITKKKDINQLIPDNTKRLKRTLTAFDLVLLGLGVVVGSGIFVLTGIVAALHTGPAITISFLISGAVCILIGLAYAELSSIIPVSGGSYTFCYVIFGEIFAWIAAWCFLMVMLLACSGIANGWSGYITGFLSNFGINIPRALTLTPFEGGIMDLPAMIIIFAMAYILVIGIKESNRANKILVFIKFATLFVFVILAIPKFHFVNWKPYMPYGIHGILTGSAILFFAYGGFDILANASEECHNPRRDLPIGIIGALTVCTTIYVIIGATLTGIAYYTSLNNSEPVAHALKAIGYTLSSNFVYVGALCGLTTGVLATLYGATRIIFVLSRDGMISQKLYSLHPKYQTPHLITIAFALLVSLIVGFIPLETLIEGASIAVLFLYAMILLAVMTYRITNPNIERLFKYPLVFILAPIGIICCVYLMLSLSLKTWIIFLIWILIGILIYFFHIKKRL